MLFSAQAAQLHHWDAAWISRQGNGRQWDCCFVNTTSRFADAACRYTEGKMTETVRSKSTTPPDVGLFSPPTLIGRRWQSWEVER